MKEEAEKAKELGLPVTYKDGGAIKGWDGKIDQRDVIVDTAEATFHPTKYRVGVLEWLAEQSNFSCYTYTHALSIKEKGMEVLGIGSKKVHVKTEEGFSVTRNDALEATCVPLQKLSVVAQMELTACDDQYKYLVVGGCDHKVGQEQEDGRYAELEQWVRDRFTKSGSFDYKWSGRIFEPVDYVAIIGLNQGNKHIYIIIGDSGNGLTHGVLGGKLIADQIDGIDNPWGKLATHDLPINAQYKRFLQNDINDIEDLATGSGGVLNPKTSTPKTEVAYTNSPPYVHI
ncbi:MAG: hypothetical protein HETSPECPRED_010015 [Heterodermia speciosa]|uniref:FAD dependent oxidoreductase domain-containing protein n=1 Tax=Heterodermia speciosa TaxID=116794 RepID=A0A8H3G3X1_9LECA|nr:MAG: hypothetical protein HETSPECPRED_010015 [Heterodermia speciosa]